MLGSKPSWYVQPNNSGAETGHTRHRLTQPAFSTAWVTICEDVTPGARVSPGVDTPLAVRRWRLSRVAADSCGVYFPVFNSSVGLLGTLRGWSVLIQGCSVSCRLCWGLISVFIQGEQKALLFTK